MKVYTRCKKCKSDISYSTWESDRVGMKMSLGNKIELRCKQCNYEDQYEIDGFKAKENRIAHFIALLVFLIGTPIILVLLWDKIFMTNNIYTILALVTPLVIPSVIFGIISKNDRQRVSIFNRS